MDAVGLAAIIGGVVGGSLLLSCCAACCVWGRAFSLGRRRRKPKAGTSQVVLLVGDSLTQGTISFPFSEELMRRFPTVHFVNSGINGDPSYRILERLPGCLKEPECASLKAAVVLCGTNDTIAMLHPKLAETLYAGKLGDLRGRSAGWVTVSIYESNLRAIVRQLRAKHAAVIIVSPPLLGEVLPPAPPPSHPSYGPLSALPNGLLAEIADAAKRVANEEGVVYVPLLEELSARLCTALSAPGRRAFEFDARMGQLTQAAWNVLKYKLLGRSWDALSNCEHTHDAIHLNERGGAVFLDLLEPALEKLVAEASEQADPGPSGGASDSGSLAAPLMS